MQFSVMLMFSFVHLINRVEFRSRWQWFAGLLGFVVRLARVGALLLGGVECGTVCRE
jgi:hypothetical protein